MGTVSSIDPQMGIWVITLLTSYYLSLVIFPHILYSQSITILCSHRHTTLSQVCFWFGLLQTGNDDTKWKFWGFSCGSHEGGLVDEGGKSDVALGETATLVGAERDLNLVVDIEPLRMMVHLLRLQGHSGHEAKGLIEVFKEELFIDGVPHARLHPLGAAEQGQ